MFDKRSHQRSPVELAASFGVPDFPQGSNEGVITNISAGGFCFLSDRIFKIGSKIAIEVEVENDVKLPIQVKVVWVEKRENKQFQIGVEIVDTKSKNFDKFIQFYQDQIKEDSS